MLSGGVCRARRVVVRRGRRVWSRVDVGVVRRGRRWFVERDDCRVSGGSSGTTSGGSSGTTSGESSGESSSAGRRVVVRRGRRVVSRVVVVVGGTTSGGSSGTTSGESSGGCRRGTTSGGSSGTTSGGSRVVGRRRAGRRVVVPRGRRVVSRVVSRLRRDDEWWFVGDHEWSVEW